MRAIAAATHARSPIHACRAAARLTRARAGAALPQDGDYPIHAAAIENNWQVLQVLVRHFAKNYKNWTDVIDLPGEVRCEGRSERERERERRARPPLIGGRGQASGGRVPGARPRRDTRPALAADNVRTDAQGGMTPLFYAARFENPTCTRYLLSLGAKADGVEVSLVRFVQH